MYGRSSAMSTSIFLFFLNHLSTLILDWSRLQLKKLHTADKEAQRAAVNELVRHVRLSPYREIRAKILASIPQDAFMRLEKSVQRQLADALFAPP